MTMIEKTKIKAGKIYPLGATLDKKGANFALFSHHAQAVDLCLFILQDDGSYSQEQRVAMACSNDVWNIYIEGIKAGDKYGYRVAGVTDYTHGLMFNPQKLLLDPYAKAIDKKPDFTPDNLHFFNFEDGSDNQLQAPKAIIIDETYDWQDDVSPVIKWGETIVYELNVKGFSQLNHNIDPAIRGSFQALSDPHNIDYLKKLGVTTIELLPVAAHADEPHLQKNGLVNYWGYNVLAPFALDPKFKAKSKKSLQIQFKDMVKALHKAGFEVVLDVVFNHSAELDKQGPFLSLRGIDAPSYYWLDHNGNYLNFTGCGNSLNLSSSPCLQLTMDCLRYWVEEYHIDGFRFDLGVTLGRSPDFSKKSPFFMAVQQDPILQKCKFFAEPWDIGDYGYQLGKLPVKFSQWNDQFRDNIRRFWLQQSGNIGTLARRIAGSDDYFLKESKFVHNSLNLITAHDGFTLQDLVSFNYKHNMANGENNNDGHGENYSFNFGVEGLVDDDEINLLRKKAKKALLASLFLANGTPMLLAGDELGNSQNGNNNAYCQDNATTWIDWQNIDTELLDYCRQLIKLRGRINIFSQDRFLSSNDVTWLSISGDAVENWDVISGLQILMEDKFLFVINPLHVKQEFYLPNGKWKKILFNDVISFSGKYMVSATTFDLFERVV